jgi:hypothetical protein
MDPGSTLQLILDNQTRHLLRGWDSVRLHQYAVVRQSLGPKNIFLADMGLVGSHPRHTIIVKVASGAKGVESLKHEHSLYKNQLAKLQGSYVPRCYGLFSGVVNGSPFGCLLLEYIEPHVDMILDPEEFQ